MKRVVYSQVGGDPCSRGRCPGTQARDHHSDTLFLAGFCEGNQNQWRWFVPHDQPGLIALMGKDTFVGAYSIPHCTQSPDACAHGLGNLW